MAGGALWPIAITSAVAWISLALAMESGAVSDICSAVRDVRWFGPLVRGETFQPGQLWAIVLSWILMLVAMMVPLLGAPIRHVLARSLRHRRRRAVSLFLAGYLGVWLIAIAFLSVVIAVVRQSLGQAPLAAFSMVLATALVWQGSASKRRHLNRCHANRVLPAFGLAAEWASLRFGIEHGLNCVGACWALMSLPLALEWGHVLAMGAVAAFMLVERYSTPRASESSMAMMAGGALVMALSATVAMGFTH